MNKNMTWKVVLILAVIAIFTFALIPTKSQPDKIALGLDLKGGSHLVMKVNTNEALRTEVDQASERLKAQATAANLPVPTIRRIDDRAFQLLPPAGVTTTEYEKIVGTDLPDFSVVRNAEGLRVEVKGPSITAIEDQTVTRAIETIRNRVDALGVSEPIIARQGGIRGDRIVIQLPGVDDPVRVKEIIRTTAQLQFRMVEGTSGSDSNMVTASVPANMQNEVEILSGDDYDDFGRVTGRRFYAIHKTVPVTGTDLKTARVEKGPMGQSTIGFNLTPEGSRKFGTLTGANVGRQLAIVLDNKVQSAPTIESKIEDSGVITGSFTPQQASDLALILRSGSLPASLTTLEERTVGPSLGRDSIRQGVTASVIGFILVVLSVVLYYKGAGINAVVALLLNLLILLGLMAYFRATLTLPGIAGIILTLGMAIDSNVLVFERIREELRAGKSPRAAISAGFQLAFGTVVDTHLTTIIAALFLLQFGSGPVKGFAVTLLIGLGASLFTAFFVSRVIFDLVYNRPNRTVERISI